MKRGMVKKVFLFSIYALIPFLSFGYLAWAEVVKIGILSAPAPYADEQEEGLKNALRDSGYIEGKNVVYISKKVGSRVEDFEANKQLAKDMLKEGIDILATIGTQATVAGWAIVKGTEIPMVFAGITYPIEEGVIEKFGKPTGTNVTGVSYGVPPFTRLSLFRKMFPDTKRFKRIGFVHSGRVPQEIVYVKDLKALKDTSNWEIVYIDLYNYETEKPDYGLLIKKLSEADVDIIFGWYSLDQLTGLPEEFKRLQDTFTKPILGICSKFTDQGAIGGVLTDHFALGAQHASMIVRILKGEDPGKIPPEEPKGYLIDINLKKAEELGIEIPLDVIAAADRVVK